MKFDMSFSRATKGTLVFVDPRPQAAVTTLYIRKGAIDDLTKRITVTIDEDEKGGTATGS